MPSKAELWCRSKVGREHTPLITKEARVLGQQGQCGYHDGKKWLCVHHIECAVCKRILRYEWEMGIEECPSARVGAA